MPYPQMLHQSGLNAVADFLPQPPASTVAGPPPPPFPHPSEFFSKLEALKLIYYLTRHRSVVEAFSLELRRQGYIKVYPNLFKIAFGSEVLTEAEAEDAALELLVFRPDVCDLLTPQPESQRLMNASIAINAVRVSLNQYELAAFLGRFSPVLRTSGPDSTSEQIKQSEKEELTEYALGIMDDTDQYVLTDRRTLGCKNPWPTKE